MASPLACEEPSPFVRFAPMLKFLVLCSQFLYLERYEITISQWNIL